MPYLRTTFVGDASLAVLAASLLACQASDSRSYAAGGGYGGPDLSFGVPPSSASDAGVAEGDQFWLQLSADDSTSMASAQIAKLSDRSDPTLHRHEFSNYYDPPAGLFDAEDWGHAGEPAAGVRLGLEVVQTSIGASPGDPSSLALYLQLVSEPVRTETRRPWNLVYCVDVSGSMEGEKLEFVRNALIRSLDRLRDGDHVTLVTFSDDAKLLFDDLTYGDDEATMRRAFEGLATEGSTNMIAGLNLAYERALAQRSTDRLTRVILFGDGDANVGTTDVDHFASLTRDGDEEGVYLSTIGVGFGFHWVMMDTLADAGKGASVFLPNAEEASRLFGTEQFTKLVEIAADEVDVELRLPTGLALVDFSGEETSTDPEARVPSVVLAAGDDLSMIARFAYTDDATLDAPMSLRISMRPLGTGQVSTYDVPFASVRSLMRSGGVAFTRAALVDDYARLRIGDPAAPAAADLLARIDALGDGDAGLAEIRALLASPGP